MTGHIGYGENPETLETVFFATNSKTAESFSFVAPVAYTLELLMLWTDKSLTVSFGIAAVAGVIAGSGGVRARVKNVPLGRLRLHLGHAQSSRRRRADGVRRRYGARLYHWPRYLGCVDSGAWFIDGVLRHSCWFGTHDEVSILAVDAAAMRPDAMPRV